MTRTLVIGLGNPLLGDDGVGWRIADTVSQQISRLANPPPDIEFENLSLGGLRLMERMIGYQRVILIDAINLGEAPVGTVYSFPLAELPNHSGGHLSSSHDTSLITALEMGRSLGAKLPTEIYVVGVESPYVYDFSEEISPPIAAAMPQAVFTVIQILELEL